MRVRVTIEYDVDNEEPDTHDWTRERCDWVMGNITIQDLVELEQDPHLRTNYIVIVEAV